MQIVSLVTEYARQKCFTPEAWTKLEQLGEFRAVGGLLQRGDSPERVAELCTGAHVLVTGWGSPKITPVILDQLPQLKMIAHSAGSVASICYEAWERGIVITNVMPIMAMGVAEFTVTCILNGLRRYEVFINPTLLDSNPYFSVPKVGFCLRNKTVGLVGLGIIGREVVKLLSAFGCKLMVHDPFLPAEVAKDLGVTLCDLDTLMAKSDIVSLHAPGTEACKDIINEPRLRMLKPGAILVNTARGILIDHDALARVAGEGKIGVYLDVTRPEPLPADHPLRQMSNVIITPHVAGPTVEGWALMGAGCVADIERYIKGEKVMYGVTADQYKNQSTT